LVPKHLMENLIFRPSQSYAEALDRAAELWGIEPEYGDTWGKLHHTPPDVKQELLSALGVPVGSVEELDRAVEERLHREWDRLLPPVVVVGQSMREAGVPVHLPEHLAGGRAAVEFRWESGEADVRHVLIESLPETGSADLRGARYVRRQVPIPSGAPLGYHELSVTIAEGDGSPRCATTRLILCPDRAYIPPAIRDSGRAAGVAIALYGLRSKRNWGCGDFTDLEALIDWAVEELGVSFIGLNPLHAIPNRQPFNISPYLPSSIFYKNLIYLDVERIEEFTGCRRVRELTARPEFQAELEALRSAEYVEYERVDALKTRVLKLLFAAFLREWRRQTPRAQEFRAYLEREGRLLDRYATWRALDEWIHARTPDVWVWADWPEEYRDPASEATLAFARKHWRRVLFHKWVQWQLDLQLAATQDHARLRRLSIGLYHDLALATDQFGADMWAHRPFYVPGCRVGAPPDNFSPKGQDWAFPPPDAGQHREDGYRLFAESIRRNCRSGGALRIDHVMRFFRLYWIVSDPSRGAYVRDRHEDLLHIVALESVRNEVVVVGEDLGTVTDKIREELDNFGLFGYKVPYFEKHKNGQFKYPNEYAECALVASSTHDLPTLAGFWLGKDIEARRLAGLFKEDSGYREAWADRGREKQKMLDRLFDLGLLPDWVSRRAGQLPELTGELHNGMIGWLALAPSRLMVVNQEDLVKDPDQQNLPATNAEQYPNWRHKMRFSIEELREVHAAQGFTAMLRNWLARTGRLNRADVHSERPA
jgi:4-alpha-glucanotransferase